MALLFLENLESAFESNDAPPAKTTVAIGKPLLITIEHFYTGNAPQKKKVFGGEKDMDVLISSSIKEGLGTFDASPRYVNFIRPKVSDRAIIESTADTDGTELVYYASSLDTDFLVLTFNVVFDRFDQDMVNDIANALSNAAKLPVFGTAGGYLMSATGILKLGAKLGSALYDGKPFLTDTLKIDLRKDDDFSEFIILCNDDDEDFFNRCKVDIQKNNNSEERAVLIDPDTNARYKGDLPYLILRISSEERTELSAFTPHVLSGAMLEKFYGEDMPGRNKALDIAQEALSFYNDQQYLNKIKTQQERIKSGKLSPDDLTKAKSLIDAFASNIQSDEFKKLVPTAEV